MAIAEVARPGGPADPEVRDRVLTLPDRFRAGAADGFAGSFTLEVGDDTYHVAIARGRCIVKEGDRTFSSARISTDRSTWLALDAGELSSIDAFLEDRLRVRGNVEYAVRMQSLFHFTGRRRGPQDVEHRSVRAGRHLLSSLVFGQGPDVVLLHGLGATKLSYLPLLPALAREHRVIVPDLPGHGESTKPRVAYTPALFAGVVKGLFDELGVARAVVVGNSMGGRIALEVAAEFPDRVRGLVLLDPAAAGVRFPFYTRLLRMLPTGVGAVPIPLRRRIVAYGIRTMFADPRRLPRAAYLAGADEFIRVYRLGRAPGGASLRDQGPDGGPRGRVLGPDREHRRPHLDPVGE
jgi:pimeloyl-ACP methyl ester carboxylesterase